MKQMRCARVGMMAALMMGSLATPVLAQTAAPGIQREAGTVKATSAGSLTLTTAAGQDITVSVPEAAKVLLVPPGSKDLKSATPGTLGDVAAGDRVLIFDAPNEAGTELTATRVILMKARAIAQSHAAEDAAWAQGGGGIVRSVDAATGRIVIASGLKKVTVVTTPSTIVRRYSGDSVRFADAQASTVAVIQPGDQMRVRGTKSADGATITADELVTGAFHNFSGLLTAVDPAAGTITLKDLTTKKMVTVAVTAGSDVRRLPPMLAQRVARQMKGGSGGEAGQGGEQERAHTEDASHGAQREGRAGMDLSQMLSRLPTEALAGLKVGDAVMIVATSPAEDSQRSTAVTLLAGVEPILTASPSGQGMTLSPWSMGGGGDESGEGGDTQGAGSQHGPSPQSK